MTNSGSGNNYRRMARNIVLIMVLVGLVPLALIEGYSLRNFGEVYRKKVLEHMAELVQKHSQNIDRFLIERLADIRMLARSNTFEQLSDLEFLHRRLAMLKEENNGVFVDLGLVNSDGKQIAYAGPFNLSGADYSQTYWFKQALKSEQYISDVFTGLRGSPHFIVAVKQRWDGQDWILRATIDFEAFNVLVENIRLGKTGFAFILNRAGEFQTKPRSEVNLTGRPFMEFLLSGLDIRTTTIVETDEGPTAPSIVVMSPLKLGQWILCCQQESADAFMALNQTEIAALIALIVSGVLVTMVAFFMARRMVDRLTEVDKEKAVMSEKVIEAGRLASIGELAAGIAHEINNPVAIMVEEAGWIQDLKSDGQLNTPENMAELDRALIQIRTQGGRCKEITHKLLSFARKTDPLTSEVDLNQVVLDAVSLLRQKTRYANILIRTELEPNLPEISVSPSEIQQVILNLINNAVDAIGSGGGEVLLTSHSNNEEVELEITDTGQGIPEVDLDRIFDPFFTTKPVGQGTGLGLSICFGIINKLGGSIRVRSRVGEGTTFTIHFPLAGRIPAKNQSARPEASLS